MRPPCYARVVVDVDPAHLDRPFDYCIPEDVTVVVGHRVKVPFHGRRRQGWVVGVGSGTDVDPGRVRDLEPWGALPFFDESDLGLFRWVARRYAAPLAHVLRHALPTRVAAVERDVAGWGPVAPTDEPSGPSGPSGRWGSRWSPGWDAYDADALLAAVAALVGPPEERRRSAVPPAFWWRGLPGGDVDALTVELVRAALAGGRGVVVVAPDPRSPLVEAVQAALPRTTVDHRSARADRTRYRAFLRGRTGHARVAVGERGAVFAPVPRLGLVIVDDEANPSYKERRSPRHHAREVALARARLAGAVCVLRGDLPSAALWRLLEAGHVRRVAPHRAREREARPRIDVVDLGDPRPGVRRARLSPLANGALGDVVAAGGHAVVLAARGGIGAALACTACGRRRECPVCAGSLRPSSHDEASRECSGCGWTGAAFPCRGCGATRTAPLAAGAARLTQELGRAHPAAQVVRMEGFDAPGPTRAPAIAVMTRGSVVDDPGWLAGHRAGLVIAPDADGMLSRPSVDAGEDTLRLWFAVARMTGRMVLQTRDPGHHAVQALVRWDPDGFWAAEAPRRAQLGFPPARSLVRVESPPADADGVGTELRDALPAADELLGPSPEGEWIVKAADLPATTDALYPLRQRWDRDSRGVRVDVDPSSAL